MDVEDRRQQEEEERWRWRMERRGGDVVGMSRGERFLEMMERSCCRQFCMGPNPWMARYAYGLIFLITNLLAWVVRDYAQAALSDLQRLKGCQGASDCLGTEGVLRVSFGCSIFYFIMFLTTIGTSKLYENREHWHSGWWLPKITLWIGLMVVPFFIPSFIIQLYGKIALFGAGIFLLIQLISITSFVAWLNDYFTSKKYIFKCRIHAHHALATSAYVASTCGIVLMYIWYVPKLSCTLNLFFITLTLLLVQLMVCVSLHSKVNGGFLTPGLMGLYVVFICWCGLRSEPSTETCNKKAEVATDKDWLTIISFVIALLAMVIATFATGIDSKCFEFKKEESQSPDDVPYGYGFFHFVFAMGSMYFAMLFISWNPHHTMQKWTIDVGWTSTWVKVVNEWLAACIYIWKMVAPVIWKSRQTVEPM